jgi:2-dehydro-3-deoxyphosphogluconate aldolase/(4S)-4-hydroxy-2-oxoglutarate aldolase
MNEFEVFSRLQSAGVIAVLIIDRVEDAAPVAEALLAGGIVAIELTLRTPVALEALRHIKRCCPEILAGIGTVLSPDQVARAVDAGAEFAVAPGTNPRVIEAALAAGLPFAPGICTPSDIERALEYDRRLLKFFPAEPCGGLAYLRTIAAPYAHLGLKYIPLGGITAKNMADYLQEPAVGGVGGSWFASREIIAAREWPRITESAREAAAVRDNLRKARI